MSCFSRVTTKMTDLATVRKALEALGHRVRERATEARGWSGNSARADLVVATATDYDIGLVRAADGTFEAVADWGMTGVAQDAFVAALSQKYSYLWVTETARRKGFTVAEERVDDQGTVRLLLRRFT